MARGGWGIQNAESRIQNSSTEDHEENEEGTLTQRRQGAETQFFTGEKGDPSAGI
jgi:hypothetical protein